VHLASYLELLHLAEGRLAGAFAEVAGGHGGEPDVAVLCRRFADQSTDHADALAPMSNATVRRSPRSPSGSTASCSAAPAQAASGCCATCTTCT
jgi:hypothetical protein